MDTTQFDLPPLSSKRTDSSSSKNGRVKSVNGGLELVLDAENGPEQSFVKSSHNLRTPSSPPAFPNAPSADSHSAALLPINLNSELNMVSPSPTEKGVSKIPAVPQRTDKESTIDSNSIFTPVVIVKGEEERVTEPISESQESISNSGSQQESCCTSLTSESISSTIKNDPGSEQKDAVRDDTTTITTVNTDTNTSAVKEDHEVKGDSNGANVDYLNEQKGQLQAQDQTEKPECRSVGTSPSVPESDVPLTSADQDNSKLDSSLGSTLSVLQAPREEQWDNISIGTSVPNSEPHNHPLTAEESKLERSISLDPGTLHKLIHFDKDDSAHSEISSVDEARIRAELELEIERDLEREIKAKIMILGKRLEELHKMQSKRCSRQGHNAATDGFSESEEATAVKEVIREVTVLKQALKNPLKSCDDNDIVKPSLHREAASAKRPSSASGRRLVPLNGNQNETTEAQKRWAKVSGFVSAVKGFDTSPSPCCDHKHGAKIWPVCPRSHKEERVINTRPKKFDWTQTLRPDLPTPPPKVSVRKVDVTPNDSEANEAPCGNTKRTLFLEEGLSAPAVKESPSSTTAAASAKNETTTTATTPAKPRRSDFTSPTASSAGKTVRKPFMSRSPSPVPRGAATPVKPISQKPATAVKQSCDTSMFQDTKPARNAMIPAVIRSSRKASVWK